MKKGFTLSEVLITLAIIGVVASLTIPALLNQTSDKEYESKLKKLYNLFSQAGMSIMYENGDTMAGAIGSNENGMLNVFASKLSFITKCYENQGSGICWHKYASDWKKLNGQNGWGDFLGEARGILNDGTMVIFWLSSSTCSSDWGDGKFERGCGTIILDVNGLKKPNVFGLDIFEFLVLESGIYPNGADTDLNSTCNKSADPSSKSGYGCAAKVLSGGKVNY